MGASLPRTGAGFQTAGLHFLAVWVYSETPPPAPPRSGEGEKPFLLPLSASGRGLGGGACRTVPHSFRAPGFVWSGVGAVRYNSSPTPAGEPPGQSWI